MEVDLWVGWGSFQAMVAASWMHPRYEREAPVAAHDWNGGDDPLASFPPWRSTKTEERNASWCGGGLLLQRRRATRLLYRGPALLHHTSIAKE